MKKSKKHLIYGGTALASFMPMIVQARGMMNDTYDDSVGNAAGGAIAGLSIVLGFLIMLFWVGMILLWVFWLVMVIDIARRDWKKDGDRAAYLVLVIFLNILGAIIYYFAVKRHLDKK